MPTARQLAALTQAQRHALLAEMSSDELAALEHHWPFWARVDQLPPSGNWRVWLLLGGRGSGKTRASAEWVRAEMESGRRRSMGLIGSTADDVRNTMIEGLSGLLSISPNGAKPTYEPSSRRIVYPNGAVIRTFSAEEPERLRGPNFDGLWADEICAWENASAAWDMAQLALRIPGPAGDPPCAVVSTTPKPLAILKQIMGSPSTRTTRAKTSDNAANLDASTLQYYQDKYGGSRLGRQELDAELLTDLEGALWTRDLIETARIRFDDSPEHVRRIVVAVDPPGASSKTSAECGIVVAAIGHDGRFFVIADLSARMSPEKWSRVAVNAYHTHGADRIVVERNFGGDMVESTIRAVDPNVPVKMVTASRGKQLRAEPIASLYEQHRVHHVGEFPSLEDQMVGWAPAKSGPSPDRVDALVWALTELSGGVATSRLITHSIDWGRTKPKLPRSFLDDESYGFGIRFG